MLARNVVLATGAYQKPKVPPPAGTIPEHVLQFHSNDYRNPARLPDGAVLVMGTGQSGGQIAEELSESGRDVHLAVSTCPEAPRRYRGRDLVYWLMEVGMHGAEHGVSFQTPPPAGRFACNPLLTGAHGGRDIHLRDLARQRVTLHGRLEAAEDDLLLFSDDFAQRLRLVETGFSQRFQPVIDAYITAADIDAPPPDPPRDEDWEPVAPTRLNLAAENVSSIIWATGYKLDFSFLDFPVLDEWNYPRQNRGVTEQTGLYVIGLPWLTGQHSSLLSGVGRDAAHIARHIAARTAPR
jgi:putative flavoprotein involved in K+ transport